jgi:hypothetical protein
VFTKEIKSLDLNSQYSDKFRYITWAILCLGLLIRAGLTFYVEPFLHWDEAPQAYMAQLIANGKIFPLVLFQIPYIGALEEYLLALFMLVFGDEVSTVNLFYFTISSLSLLCARLVYIHYFGNLWACWALLFYAISHPFVILISLQAYSFGALALFETLIFLLLLRHVQGELVSMWWLLAIGLANGLSLYNNILSVGISLLSIWLVLSIKKGKHRMIFAAGFVLGYIPMIAFNIANDFISYQFLVAKFLGVTGQMVQDLGIGAALWQGVINKVAGNGPPSDMHLIFSFPRYFSSGGYYVQVVGIVVFVGLSVVSYLDVLRGNLWSWRRLVASLRLDRVALYLCLFVLILPGVGQVRYMVSLLVFMPILACDGLRVIERRYRSLSYGLGAILVAYLGVAHIAVVIDDATDYSDEYAPVLDFLIENDLTHGYGSYPFQAYSAFLSKGVIKISPQIGPVYVDKIPSFSREVDREDEVFYILPRDSPEYWRVFKKRKISYSIKDIGPWRVLWGFSERLYPLDILAENELARPDGYYRWSYKNNPAVLNVYRGGH